MRTPLFALFIVCGCSTGGGIIGPPTGADLGASGQLDFASSTDQGVIGPGGVKRVFVTQHNYPVAFGGLQFADTACNTSAQSRNLGGTWVAWLSTPTTNAIDRVVGAGPWYLVDQKTRVFNDRTNLAATPLAPIDEDETGALLTGNVWTGTDVGGHAFLTRDESCNGWTSTNLNDAGSYGDSSANDRVWTVKANIGCDTMMQASLYCFEL
jgi:hypothetical protein